MSRLFYEDERDAVRSMIAAGNKTVKQCAQHLWPHMKPDSAHAKLYAQLDGKNESEQLKFAEVIALMRFCQEYDPLLYICDDTLHARPHRRAIEDEKVDLVEAINGAAATMSKCMARLEHLQTMALQNPK